jgi:hypothetical protein
VGSHYDRLENRELEIELQMEWGIKGKKNGENL